MKTGVYYVAPNPNGTSAQLIRRMQEQLLFPIEPQNVSEPAVNAAGIKSFDRVIFLTATYGDQELNDAIEAFTLQLDKDLSAVRFLICEVGNYYGYDDYAFGSGQIIETVFTERGATKLMETNSVDSLPLIDWRQVDAWIARLNEKFSGQ